MTHHQLKTWPAYFDRVWTGEKTYEVRYDDRGYQAGDKVTLREYDPTRVCPGLPTCVGTHGIDPRCGKYTGRTIDARIGCVTASVPGRGGHQDFTGRGWVVFSLLRLEHTESPTVLESATAPRPTAPTAAAAARVIAGGAR